MAEETPLNDIFNRKPDKKKKKRIHMLLMWDAMTPGGSPVADATPPPEGTPTMDFSIAANSQLVAVLADF